jgi:hypothetical protein
MLAQNETTQDDFPGVNRVVAIGDVHGDCDAMIAVLRIAGLLDASGHWSGGTAHLVQMGDLPSRGPQSRQAFDVLMRIEGEAAAAGGRVHALIGNHDAGVIYGDLRNVLPEEYGEFRQPDSEARLAQAFKEHLAALRAAGRAPDTDAGVAELRAQWIKEHPPGFVEHRAAFAPNGTYGAWIRQHNSVIRINDSLFLHGGIAPKYAAYTRQQMNRTIRAELAKPESIPPGLTTTVEGPLWYRGLAEGDEKTLQPHVNAVLRAHGVKRIVIGHTVTRTAILPRFGSAVINTDIGLSRFYGRPPACLVIEGSRTFVLHDGKAIDLPRSSDRMDYLKACAAADPRPELFEPLIQAEAARAAGSKR